MHTSIFERTARGVKEVLRYTLGDKGEAVPSNPSNMWHKEFAATGAKVPADKNGARRMLRIKVSSGKRFMESLPKCLKGSYIWAVFNP